MSKKVRILPFLLRSGQFQDSHEVNRLLTEGRVTVGGRAVTSPSFEFRPSTKTVTVDGRTIEARKEYTILFNKPIGVLCQKNNDRTSVWQYLEQHGKIAPQVIRSLVSVGRLDIDTEGMLILTTDGDLANSLLQPLSKVPKTYEVLLLGYVSDEDIATLQRGVPIILKEDGKRTTYKTKPCILRILSRNPQATKIAITVTEGKKRQVRLMFGSVGHTITQLRRVAIGRLLLGNLRAGETRQLSDGDISLLQNK